MSLRRRHRIPAVVLAVVATGLALWLATVVAGRLSRRGDAGAASASHGRGEPSATYTVRGRVVMIPETGKPTAEFQVHHEEIPEFVSATGAVGMSAMIMPFPLGPGVSLDGIVPGDAVELTFGVWWTPGKQGYQVLKLVELPRETELKVDE